MEFDNELLYFQIYRQDIYFLYQTRICSWIFYIYSEVYFKNQIKEYQFIKPEFTYHIENDYLYIKSNVPAFKVFLQQNNNKFSDNFFTLLPNEEKIIQITNSKRKKNNLLIWSLYDLNKKDEK